MVNLKGLFHHFRSKRILVAGDFMLDKYTTGKVSRISPEAPVPVLHVKEEKILPGGAGNVILNLLALKAHVIPLGRIGSDQEGKTLKNLLQEKGANVSYLFEEKSFTTPLKNRLIAGKQQIVRVDFEKIEPLSHDLEKKILSSIDTILLGVDLVAISDYGKGFLTNSILEALIQKAKKRKLLVIIDPKGNDFSKYKNAFMIKPNLQEAYAATSLPPETPLNQVAKTLLKQIQSEYLLITRSEEGMSLFDKNGKEESFPVVSKEVLDVTGAGDTVLSTLSAFLANDFSLNEAIKLSNVAAGIAIEHVGCVSVSLIDMMKKLFKIESKHKVFDEDDLPMIGELFQKEKASLLVLEGTQEMDTKVFQTIKKLSSQFLVIYLSKPYNEEFLSLLSSLEEVDLIILGDSFNSISYQKLMKEIVVLENCSLAKD